MKEKDLKPMAVLAPGCPILIQQMKAVPGGNRWNGLNRMSGLGG